VCLATVFSENSEAMEEAPTLAPSAEAPSAFDAAALGFESLESDATGSVESLSPMFLVSMESALLLRTEPIRSWAMAFSLVSSVMRAETPYPVGEFLLSRLSFSWCLIIRPVYGATDPRASSGIRFVEAKPKRHGKIKKKHMFSDTLS